MNPKKKKIVTEKKELGTEKKEAVNHERIKIADEQMKKLTGGTGDYSFSDFFDSEGFDKELVDDGTGGNE